MSTQARAGIVIVGGGPVGLMVAALAARRCADALAITVIDAGPPPAWHADKLDLRVYALSRASERLFERVGAWDEVRGHVSPYQRMRVWQGDDPHGLGSVGFDAAELGEPDLGSIAEDALLRTVLYEHLARDSEVDLRFGARLERIDVGERTVAVRTHEGETLRAKLVIGADGAASRVRALSKIPVTVRDYRQAAVVAHVASEQPHCETAWQRFGTDGPLALLPLRDGRSSIVWTTALEHAEHLLAVSDEEFARELCTASSDVLGRFYDVSERARFVLRAQHARSYCKARVALVGDAAHTVHPLAGQGLNLGLLDAAALAEAIEEAIEAQQDPGDWPSLARYERRRKGENLKMQLAFDALDTLFRLPQPAGALRCLGMRLVDAGSFAKHALARRALGVAGPLPRAARALDL